MDRRHQGIGGVDPADAMPTDPTLAEDLGAELEFRGDQMESELEVARREAATNLETAQRLQAEFDNYRKRMAREKLDWIAFANEKLVLDLLPVLDHFELGLADCAQNGTAETVTEGFQLIYNQLRSALEKAGVQTIDAEGQPFDPNLHEAISMLPSDTVPAEQVLAQSRRGYKIGAKLLRPAQVVVSSGPAAD